MAPAQQKPIRKRNRKRKRRVASDTSSSEDNSSSSDESVAQKPKPSLPVKQQTKEPTPASEESESESSSSSSSEDDSDSDNEVAAKSLPSSSKPARPNPPPLRDSPSPPPTAAIPPFIPPNSPEAEQALKEKFRRFWMASLAEGFKDDLEEIRKEPNLGPSRLALLVESLASGADVFSSNTTGGGVNEMEVVLDEVS
ncbi:hypothetical protein HYDPIDRAFT_118537 [Hydnomerulius pinastri MD-312]|uniref:Ribosome assembly protein 3 n=1 Tax=Hydnomerulius pinastri MD-312 TaxID=994086 RepID=A0A0C9W8P0_9AGAM|nr:hypothetical protein HYDPIDRAFT_118537 [Hydnomerulius pinastri MD-312]